MSECNNNVLLDVKDITTVFSMENFQVTAVDNVSFSLLRGQVLGLVGESGCGKTITSLSILDLLPSNAFIVSGKIFFSNSDLMTLSLKEKRMIRGNKIALIPQDPLTSLNPLFTVGNQIIESIVLHHKVGKQVAREKTIEVLNQVKIPNPERLLDCYPHELSGGMRQRILIAMALSCDPELLIADEPTTALDVTVQAQILDLIRDIQKKVGMSLLLITHDLGVVAEMCDYVLVMYAGQVVEYSDVRSLYTDPKHPYTLSLLKSMPTNRSEKLEQIEGQPPSLIDLPQGCYFQPRCPKRISECEFVKPEIVSLSDNRKVRCILYNE